MFNTIDGGGCATNAVQAIAILYDSSPEILNNVLVCTRTSLYQNSGIQLVLFTGTPTVQYNCIRAAIDEFGDNLETGNWDATNSFEDPVLGGADGMHLTSSTPASVYAGGLTILSVALDKDGNPRTAPYSMGAYERDP
jgi:hypothetical protein